GHEGFKVRDVLTGAQYWWNSQANYVALEPGHWPAHVFVVEP
ncbi:MAG: alpha-amylase, partial [Bacteroidota bacterium]